MISCMCSYQPTTVITYKLMLNGMMPAYNRTIFVIMLICLIMDPMGLYIFNSMACLQFQSRNRIHICHVEIDTRRMP